MKKSVSLFLIIAIFFASCATTNISSKTQAKSKSPEMIDHKNQQFGKEIPEWVSMEQYDIEQLPRYKDVYVFKFVSEKAKDLEGSQIWMKNFTVTSEVSRLISQRIRDKAASAVGGNSSSVDAYTKELVKLVSEASMNGLKKEGDYWTCRRFFNSEGDVEGDFYSTFMLYSIPRKTLDEIIKEAIAKANEKEKTKSQEEIDLRNMVNKAMTENF